jgi:restriction system protein
MRAFDRVPTVEDLCLPTLRVLEQRGGSASIREISEDMAALLKLTDAVREVVHGDGPQSEVDYRAAWARTYLKHMDAATNSSRGVWSITGYGRELTAEADTAENDVQARILDHIRTYRRSLLARRAKNAPSADSPSSTEDDADTKWTDELLSVVREMSPGGFERLCQRLLRESGFTKVEVTGRTGDGGIDGIGVLRVNLISFQIVFQCKRYAGSVGSSAIRDFRGSMVGRADKGLFITTGRFSPSAEQEAVRDGAPAIDLIDGNGLCGLLKGLDLGVRTDTVEKVTVEASFFESI